MSELVVDVDKMLRRPDVLNLPKARKTQLPTLAQSPKEMG